ncbi:hypothetical protein SJAV_25260 [Sulfurisphaera javensis]|uniref:DUF2029 domain-containing protein n=1 Tax=Sulfurisphaera javensis TaxID=2049879 RepID=A0AAT9GUZ6_9CREN
MEKSLQLKMSGFLLSILVFIFANQVWSSGGYINPSTEISTWLLIVFGFISLFISLFIRKYSEKYEYVLFSLTLASVITFIIGYYHSFPRYGTDEIFIDYSAAKLVIHGINPYTYKFELLPNEVLPFFITPTVYGGYVDTLQYPALSFLLQVPFALLNAPPDLLLIVFNLLSYIIIFFYFKKINTSILAIILALVSLLININWMFYSIGGVTDIVWTDLVALSYVYKEKPIISSILLGLAISYKQTALIILPFYLYFLYKDIYKSSFQMIRYLLIASLTFVFINLPFIVSSPITWIDSVSGIATQPILGVGLGISALNFTGAIHVGRITFYVLPAIVYLTFIYIYILYYDRLKYTFPAYPVLVFFFYDRLLLSYLIYWPYLALIMLPESSKVETENKVRLDLKKLLPVILISMVVAGFLFTRPYSSSVVIVSAKASDPLMLNNIVTEITLEIYYNPQPGDPRSLPLSFRILPYYPTPPTNTIQTNGLLWIANASLHPGLNIISIYPRTFVDLLNYNNPFVIVGYYGNIRAYYESIFNNDTYYPFQNPYLALASYTVNLKSYPYGWYFGPNDQAGYAWYIYRELNNTTYSPGILTLYAVKNLTREGWAASQLINPCVNLTYLGLHNYTYTFQISRISSNISNFSIVSNGYPVVFYGIEINNGKDQIWIGYSNVSACYHPNNNLYVILENTTKISINFSEIYKIAEENNYYTSNVNFIFIVGTTLSGYAEATFMNFNLTRNL